MAMKRKQYWITLEQKEKLQRLSAKWGVSQAEVARIALDRYLDQEEARLGITEDVGQ